MADKLKAIEENINIPAISSRRSGPVITKPLWLKLVDAITEFLSLLLFRNKYSLAVKLFLPLLLMGVLFVIPLVFVFRVSFWEYERLNFVRNFTLENYIYFLGEPTYQRAIIQSIQLSLLVALLCLLLGYPLALILTQARIRFGSVVTFILITPLFISVVIRTFGWLVLLEVQGLVNATLQRLGMIQQPLQLLNNMFGVTIDLVNVCLVFMVIPIVASLAGIPKSLSEAARTLGANSLRVWWSITLPLSAPGVMAGFVLVFAIAISAYVQPRILGGARFLVIPVQIWRQVLGVLNWPLGAAMGFTILVASILVSGLVYLAYRLLFPHVAKTRQG